MVLKFEKDKLISRIKSKKDLFVAVIVFVAFFLSVAKFVADVNPKAEDIPNYKELTGNNYGKYEDLIKGSGIKKMINNEQFKSLKYSSDLIRQEHPERREDVFLKRF